MHILLFYEKITNAIFAIFYYISLFLLAVNVHCVAQLVLCILQNGYIMSRSCVSAHDCAHFTSETTERISIKFSILGCTIKATEHDEFSSYRSICKHGPMLPATQIVLQLFLRNDGLQNRFVNEISCTYLSHYI